MTTTGNGNVNASDVQTSASKSCEEASFTLTWEEVPEGEVQLEQSV